MLGDERAEDAHADPIGGVPLPDHTLVEECLDHGEISIGFQSEPGDQQMLLEDEQGGELLLGHGASEQFPCRHPQVVQRRFDCAHPSGHDPADLRGGRSPELDLMLQVVLPPLLLVGQSRPLDEHAELGQI